MEELEEQRDLARQQVKSYKTQTDEYKKELETERNRTSELKQQLESSRAKPASSARGEYDKEKVSIVCVKLILVCML